MSLIGNHPIGDGLIEFSSFCIALFCLQSNHSARVKVPLSVRQYKLLCLIDNTCIQLPSRFFGRISVFITVDLQISTIIISVDYYTCIAINRICHHLRQISRQIVHSRNIRSKVAFTLSHISVIGICQDIYAIALILPVLSIVYFHRVSRSRKTVGRNGGTYHDVIDLISSGFLIGTITFVLKGYIHLLACIS